MTAPLERTVHAFAWLADLEVSAPREQAAPVAARIIAAWLNANPKPPGKPGKGPAWGLGNAMNYDQLNVLLAEETIKQFKPELLVVNMTQTDICHTDFTGYCNNLRKADYAAAHLWQTIQQTPGLKDDTIMIIAPEHGRNETPNSIRDQFGNFAIDHGDDAMSKDIFCMVLGPQDKVNQNQVFSNVKGETIIRP